METSCRHTSMPQVDMNGDGDDEYIFKLPKTHKQTPLLNGHFSGPNSLLMGGCIIIFYPDSIHIILYNCIMISLLH